MDNHVPQKKNFGLLLKIGIPIVAVIAIVIVAFVFIFSTNPLAITYRTITNLETEMMQRLDSTPLRAVFMALDKLENGTLAVDFEYSDRWSYVEGTATLVSNSRNRSHAFVLEVESDELDIFAEAFLNSERLAVGSQIIDDNFYGITFSTFGEDIRTFGAEIGMDRHTMDMLTSVVEILETLMNTGNLEDSIFGPYMDLVTDFIANLNPTSERTQLRTGGESINVRRIEYIITADDIVTLINDTIEMMRSDDDIRDFYNAITGNEDIAYEIAFMLTGRGDTLSYNEFLRELRDASRDLDRNLAGEITISLYVGSRDRLMRMEYEIGMRYRGERIRINATYDFGTSAQDTWTFTTSTNFDGQRSSTEITWEYSTRANRITNTITTISEFSGIETEQIMSSEWSRDSGRFILFYEHNWGFGRDGGELGGLFTYDRNGFSLIIDNPFPRHFDQRLDLEITGTTGNQVRNIDFINIDRWTMDMLEDIDDALWDAGLGGLGFGRPTEAAPVHPPSDNDAPPPRAW